MQITIPTPPTFNFRRTAISHGWYDLPPFELKQESWTLTRVIDLDEEPPVTVAIRGGARGLRVTPARAVGKRAMSKITRDVRHMLRLDDDMTRFYYAVAGDPDFSWIAASGAGRLLRAPTVFEDLVKMICTTNCSWALTDKMINGLVDALGRKSSDGRSTFPTPEMMASKREKFYRDEVRAGYRAPYLIELAERVAGGDIDVESWLTSALPTPELKREMKGIKGVGDYAAENMLKLVGRYDGLALDSWVRGKFARIRNGARKTSDKKIERYYSRWGEWRGLALWCDMTRDWLEDDGRPLKW
ncbi:MAG TPA: Fe-S cluster assembly protein HesB [Blastocatellia bacterium]|nr:Fe-S cluster assembly protein HesB [Blastocatellia bacterium]